MSRTLYPCQCGKFFEDDDSTDLEDHQRDCPHHQTWLDTTGTVRRELKVTSIVKGDRLDKAVEAIRQDKPLTYVFTYIDPNNGQAVIMCDGATLVAQLGLIERAKFSIMGSGE